MHDFRDTSAAKGIGAIAATATATYVTALLFMLAASAEEPGFGFVAAPFAALLGIPFGFVSAFVVLLFAFGVAEIAVGERWIFQFAGSAAGLLHTGVGLSLAGDSELQAVRMLSGFLLTEIAADTSGGPALLFAAAGIGGLVAGRVYARLACRR